MLAVVAACRRSTPRYTIKKFVSPGDSADFKRILPEKNGFHRTYIVGDPEIWDLDDDSTTYVRGGAHTRIFFEGHVKNHQREGTQIAYLVDSLDHNKRYKIWEQEYANDKLNGQWRTYTLRGTLANYLTFKERTENSNPQYRMKMARSRERQRNTTRTAC